MHGNDLRFLVRHFNTDGTFTRHRGNDTNTRSTQAHHNIVLQHLDLRHADTCFRYYFIERYGRTDRCFDTINFYAIVAQGRYNSCSVRALFLFIYHRSRLVVIDLEHIQTRELKELQVFAGIVRTEFRQQRIGILSV